MDDGLHLFSNILTVAAYPSPDITLTQRFLHNARQRSPAIRAERLVFGGEPRDGVQVARACHAPSRHMVGEPKPSGDALLFLPTTRERITRLISESRDDSQHEGVQVKRRGAEFSRRRVGRRGCCPLRYLYHALRPTQSVAPYALSPTVFLNFRLIAPFLPRYESPR
jgi:hypothetical protein